MAKKRKPARQTKLPLEPVGQAKSPQAPVAVEEVLDELDPRQKQVLTDWFSVAFSGPLPPPQIVAGYDHVIPDGANRIMEMAEREQEHTHDQESAHSTRLDRLVDLEHLLAVRGQAIGALLMIVLILAALVFAYLEKFPVALGTFLSAVAVQIGAWVLNRASRQQPQPTKEDKPVTTKK